MEIITDPIIVALVERAEAAEREAAELRAILRRNYEFCCSLQHGYPSWLKEDTEKALDTAGAAQVGELRTIIEDVCRERDGLMSMVANYETERREMDAKNLEQHRTSSELRDDLKELIAATQAFSEKFNAWIMTQNEDVKFATAMNFGPEYERIQIAIG